MAGYETLHRANPLTNSNAQREEEGEDQKKQDRSKYGCPLSIPSTPEAARARIIRNLGRFGLYYTIFIWVGLYISLIPARKDSLIGFVSISVVTSIYLLLLHDFPDSRLVNFIDKRLVLGFIAKTVVVELVATKAGIHLLASLGIGCPLILIHAALWAGLPDYSSSSSTTTTQAAFDGGEPVQIESNKAGDDQGSDLV